ncbi:MCP methyltransferase, CheR-type [Acidimicrobium ferrooxidans DSM 10331]|uniref:MCP methyltransferase, CheR-type n=1 Tax=Acidimicrobium ferrooxidans (strain DSM 10331 / JCM 15462 / NBRC 103882 / ICP) TaxID=525909 RepID=C7M286_ACIFD|nr:protein-glutamate O-methyltransferase CheR [Acidimicrobium ferrooxidans]ACU53184.1 MCP methyltransferase, CheR-type [Acidimicrobium ferrooxidans DSM 10331]
MVDPGVFQRIRAFLRREIGVDLGADRAYLVETRLGSARSLGRWRSIDALTQAAEAGDLEARRRLVEALVTTETFFFRDSAAFDALRTRVLPELFEQRRGGTIAIWCAASSSGQEPYSIAILVASRFPSLRSRVRILATDVSEDMVERTRRGEYSAFEVQRGLEPRMLEQAFVPIAGGFAVRDEIRRMVEVRLLNLAQPFPSIGPFDVVFVRNVLIYVPPTDRPAILARVAERMRPGAYLVLGNGESVGPEVRAFERASDLRAPIYRRVDGVCRATQHLRDSRAAPSRGGGGATG